MALIFMEKNLFDCKMIPLKTIKQTNEFDRNKKITKLCFESIYGQNLIISLFFGDVGVECLLKSTVFCVLIK